MFMEKTKLFRKNDIIIVLVLLSLAAAGLFVFHLTHMGEGRKVRVTVDGELFGEYDLGTKGKEGDFLEFDAVAGGQGTLKMNGVSDSKSIGKTDMAGEDDLSGKENIQRIEIPGKVGKCVMVIDGAEVYMESADCPNQICVHHSSISHKGETIICLPNRVVIEIVD